MTHDEMFQLALKRPVNYYDLGLDLQWEIDKKLGILDWEGPRTAEEKKILSQHHGVFIE